MYQFSKHHDEDGIWRFEMGGLTILIDNFYIKDEKYWIRNPSKAIAFFNVNGHVYGVSNELKNFRTVEDFYDSMVQQYAIIKNGGNNKHTLPNNNSSHGRYCPPKSA